MAFSMSLDTDALIGLYEPFQPVSPNGWFDEGGTAAYFVSQGSEYRLVKPKSASRMDTATGDILQSLQVYVGGMAQQLAASTNAQARALGSSLQEWLTKVESGQLVEFLTLPVHLEHIRNNEGDDEADLSLVYVYCDPLGAGLLMQVDSTLDWAGWEEKVQQLLNVYAAYTSIPSKDSVSDFIDLSEFILMGEALDLVSPMSVLSLTLLFVDLWARALINRANDGGRVNFLAVIAHAIQRCSACVRPSSAGAGYQPTLDADALGAAWCYSSKESTIDATTTKYLEGVYFSDYPSMQVTNGIEYTFDPTDPYTVGMPELSWSKQGMLTLATAKISSPDEAGSEEDVYVVVFLVFGPGGKLLTSSVATQSNASSQSIAVPSPNWMPVGTCVNAGIVQKELDTLGLHEHTSIQLQYVVPGYMGAIQKAFRAVPGNWTSTAQPTTAWTMTWSTPAHVDTGAYPSLGVRGDGTLVECHSDGDTVAPKLYSNHGHVDGSGSVSWSNKDKGDKYDSGDWPSLAVQSSSNGALLEIHTGGTNNLYWETGSISGGSPSFSGSGKKFSSGTHPSIGMRSDGVFVELHSEGVNNLAYGIGSFNGSSVSMHATDKGFLSGDYPTVVLSGGSVIEVHNDKSKLWCNVGTLASNLDSVSWSAHTYPLTLEGTHPHLVVLSDGRVVLTYDNDYKVYYALGQLQAGRVLWHVLNGSISSDGSQPAIALAPGGQVVMVFLQDGNLMCSTGALHTSG